MIALVIITQLIEFVLTIILVGVSFATFKKIFRLNIPAAYSLFILMFTFAIFDLLPNPILYFLNITYTVHNPDIVKLLDLKENIPLSESFTFDIFDIIYNFIKSCLALFIVDKRISKKLNSM